MRKIPRNGLLLIFASVAGAAAYLYFIPPAGHTANLAKPTPRFKAAAAIKRNPSLDDSKKISSKANSARLNASTLSAHPNKKSSESREAKQYWQDSEHQKTNLEFLEELSRLEITPAEEIRYLGTNDQGFKQFEYIGTNNELVTQWYWDDGNLGVETIQNQDGSLITRRYFERSSTLQEIAFEGVDSYRRAFYTSDSRFEGLEFNRDDSHILYRYAEDGRITESWKRNRDNDKEWKQLN